MADDATVSDETDYWERRHDLTLTPITDEDVEERATGRTRHLVLLAHITDEAIVSRFEAVLERLGDFDCIAPIPARNLHITVKVVGNVVEKPDGEDKFSQQDERELVTSLQSALSTATPFTVSFPRFNIFPGVVYAEAMDNGHFAQLNHRVCEVPEIPVWDRDGDKFIPHLTLGHFTQRGDYERLLQHLEQNRSLTIPSPTVENIKLVALDFSEARFPAYEMIATYELS